MYIQNTQRKQYISFQGCVFRCLRTRTGRPGVNISDGKDDANENGKDKEERIVKRSERGILGLAAIVECEIFEGHMTPG